MIGRRITAVALAVVVASSAGIVSAAHAGILGGARVSETAARVATPPAPDPGDPGDPGVGGGGGGGGAGSGGPSLDPFVCRKYSQSVAGTVSDPSLTEISGMARGRRDPSVLWVHEDSGAQADVHALTLDGRSRQTFRLAGVQATDWEDMAVGPGPADGVDYLYLGDVGDNARNRDSIVVHRVREPKVTGGSLTMLDGVASIRLRYPDGPANSEAMAVGADGTIYVITKSKVTRVYMAPYPQSTTSINVMEPVPAGTLGPEVDMSGADIRMDGRALIVRGYRMAWTWPIRPGESMATTLAREPCKTPTFHDEPQGEAVAFLANDGSYTSTSEMSHPPIRHYTR